MVPLSQAAAELRAGAQFTVAPESGAAAPTFILRTALDDVQRSTEYEC